MTACIWQDFRTIIRHWPDGTPYEVLTATQCGAPNPTRCLHCDLILCPEHMAAHVVEKH